LLQWVAGERGLDWKPGEESFATAREAQLEKLGNLVADHVDRDAVMRLIDEGKPAGLPLVSGQLVSISASQQTSGGRTQSGGGSPPAYDGASHTTPLALTMPGSDEQRSMS
jgi:adenosylcobyric acid synthase